MAGHENGLDMAWNEMTFAEALKRAVVKIAIMKAENEGLKEEIERLKKIIEAHEQGLQKLGETK